MPESKQAKMNRVGKIIRRLKKAYPEAKCALNFSTPWELLVATVLSAQCTDKRVNLVTPALFKKFPAVYDFASVGITGPGPFPGARPHQKTVPGTAGLPAGQAGTGSENPSRNVPGTVPLMHDVEDLIHSTGFYKNKAKNIVAAAKAIVERHGGKVPDRMEDLVKLPGVGRKTANVILGNAFAVPGLTVDTHMIRLNRRLGLTKHTDPVKIEFELMDLVPKKDWTMYSHWIIHHGRVRCPARKPDCPGCEVRDLCPSAGLSQK